MGEKEPSRLEQFRYASDRTGLSVAALGTVSSGILAGIEAIQYGESESAGKLLITAGLFYSAGVLAHSNLRDFPIETRNNTQEEAHSASIPRMYKSEYDQKSLAALRERIELDKKDALDILKGIDKENENSLANGVLYTICHFERPSTSKKILGQKINHLDLVLANIDNNEPTGALAYLTMEISRSIDAIKDNVNDVKASKNYRVIDKVNADIALMSSFDSYKAYEFQRQFQAALSGQKIEY